MDQYATITTNVNAVTVFHGSAIVRASGANGSAGVSTYRGPPSARWPGGLLKKKSSGGGTDNSVLAISGFCSGTRHQSDGVRFVESACYSDILLGYFRDEACKKKFARDCLTRLSAFPKKRLPRTHRGTITQCELLCERSFAVGFLEFPESDADTCE